MRHSSITPALCSAVFCGLLTNPVIGSAELIGEGPRLKPEDRITQDQVTGGELTVKQIRKAGLLVFTTPFNKADGYGDGPRDEDFADNRPTLQGNGSFLRVNGLDAQTCLECHTIVSNRTVPATLGIGGVGGINTSPMFMPDRIDVSDADFDGVADFNGRLINPPFLFGSGGVELVGREMTQELQALKQQAIDNPGTAVTLETKGVSFGTITVANGILDTSNVRGVDEDLVIRPFGRKGEFASVRSFDVGAMAFHLGMQANEAFGGPLADQDNDGVVNEITRGDLTALSLFLTTLERPQQSLPNEHHEGLRLFGQIGCADCHYPELNTNRTNLGYKITGTPDQPFDDLFYEVDLSVPPAKFRKNGEGGIVVPMFSDLKRHDMGEGLAESFSEASEEQNRSFITPRLWGIADTAPYLHDGRAFTLVEAIQAHDSSGSEAAPAAQAFNALSDDEKNVVLKMLLSLRTPKKPTHEL